jgi:CxxC motif-containing protein (DUF1111 family)
MTTAYRPTTPGGLAGFWAVVLAGVLGGGAFATSPLPDLPDLQVAMVPRTPQEAARVLAITAPTSDFSAAERFEINPAGAATVRARETGDAFSDPSANIGLEGRMTFNLGNGLFTRAWVSSPSSTIASDGLGPIFNARACQLCHLKDGRGHPPGSHAEQAVSLFLRLSVPDPDALGLADIPDYIATLPDPVYGGQLQNFALPGHAAEGQMTLDYTEFSVILADGTTVDLRAPNYGISDLGYGPLAAGLMISPRVAPQMIGLGLLEAIPAADILAAADPDDANGDGISGRANIVMSSVHGVAMLGRFGLKAGQPSVLEQTAGAFSGDMGLSTSLHPSSAGDCTDAQATCLAAPDGADAPERVEVSTEALELVNFYSRNLGVPARRDLDDPEVLLGKDVFYTAGCTACHTPKFVTGRLVDQPAQSFQLIWPYTDLLLHDMGDGLADNRPEGRATGREWRTPPLWGIGLTEQVTGRASYLHDGRARSLLEAVLWHGGEAQAARDRVVDLSTEERAALIHYLESL